MSARFPSIRIEGGLLSAELLDDLYEASENLPGLKPADFGLKKDTRLIDHIASIWSDARHHWQAFWRRASTPQPGETGVTFTRNQWITPFLSLLGYDLVFQPRAAEIDGLTFAISHRAGAGDAAPPVHVIGCWQSLDRRAESGRPRLAPHSLVQAFLNRTEALWGLVTNGLTLRLLRDSHLIRRQAYIDFDLQTLFNGEHFADFQLLFRLLHRSRLPHPGSPPHSCFLEQWYQHSLDQGGRVREHLRDGVEKAMILLANAVLNHPANSAIRQRVANKELTSRQLYEELLLLIYRLLFLMVTEERNLLSPNPVYREYYSLSRLRRLAESRAARNRHTDLWRSLFITFRLFSDENAGMPLDCPPLNGDLFDPCGTEILAEAAVSNEDFLNALWHVSMYRVDRRALPRRINYSALGVEELGSVYESLLDLQPAIQPRDGLLEFTFHSGTDRKTTGSYYTPPELVEKLVKSALVPVIDERLRPCRTPQEKEQALLAISVCDSACGSGHFLLAAARRLARELAQVRSGEQEPTPAQLRLALRDVISHCIYGVDLNPLAVELCKVALWLESHAEGKPLSFLDHRILCGNSLVGIHNLELLRQPIPKDAYKPVSGDDRQVSTAVRDQNSTQAAGQYLLDFDAARDVGELTAARRELFDLPDDSPSQIRRKRSLLDQLRSHRRNAADHIAADLWCSAFLTNLTQENLRAGAIPMTQHVVLALEGRLQQGPAQAEAEALSQRLRFFHWPLEFPEVFSRGGFDVLLCNPP